MTQKPPPPSSSSSAGGASSGGAASGGKGGQQSRPTPPPSAKPSTPSPVAPATTSAATPANPAAATSKPVVTPQAAASATPVPPPLAPPKPPVPPTPPTPPVTPPRPTPAPHPGRGPLPVLVAIGFLLLVVGLAYVWQRQEQFMAQAPAVDPAAFAGLEGQVRTLQPRLTQLEQHAAPDLKPLESRIAALENKPAPPAPDVSGPVAAAFAPLGQRMDALAKADQASQAALAAKVDAAVAKLDAAGNQEHDAAHQLVARVDGLEKKLAEAEARATQQAAQAARALRAQQALTALESGKPLGDIANAPAAAAKFATTKPPTEAELRFAFPAAAARAADASKPAGESLSVGARMLQHAESLVTVRQGDKVVVGTTAAQTLGVAKEKLDAGDLAGAVTALDGLDASAAQAMAPWRAQARSLLDARAALTAMTVSAAR